MLINSDVKKETGDVILSDGSGDEERIALPTNIKNIPKWAFIKAGTPVFIMIENTTTTQTAAGLVLPVKKNELQQAVLGRDIMAAVLREESPGVFEVLYKSNRFFVRYTDMVLTSTSDDIATLKDKETVVR